MRRHVVKVVVVLLVPDVAATLIEGKYFEIKVVQERPVRSTQDIDLPMDVSTTACENSEYRNPSIRFCPVCSSPLESEQHRYLCEGQTVCIHCQRVKAIAESAEKDDEAALAAGVSSSAPSAPIPHSAKASASNRDLHPPSHSAAAYKEVPAAPA